MGGHAADPVSLPHRKTEGPRHRKHERPDANQKETDRERARNNPHSSGIGNRRKATRGLSMIRKTPIQPVLQNRMQVDSNEFERPISESNDARF
jgi:hypothetical protein